MPARVVRLLRASEARLARWKNGRGETREIALGPEGASFERGDFDWRISTARIEEPGPFSAFPGFERVLVITEGAGAILDHGAAAARARLRVLEPHRFSGDWATRCELVGGPVADLNVLARRGKSQPEMLAVSLGQRQMRESLGEELTLLHVLGGPLTARVSGEEAPFELAPGDSLLLEGFGAHDELDLAGAAARCAVVVVRLAAAS